MATFCPSDWAALKIRKQQIYQGENSISTNKHSAVSCCVTIECPPLTPTCHFTPTVCHVNWFLYCNPKAHHSPGMQLNSYTRPMPALICTAPGDGRELQFDAVLSHYTMCVFVCVCEVEPGQEVLVWRGSEYICLEIWFAALLTQCEQS